MFQRRIPHANATVPFVYGVIEDLPLFSSVVPFVPFVAGLCLDVSHLKG